MPILPLTFNNTHNTHPLSLRALFDSGSGINLISRRSLDLLHDSGVQHYIQQLQPPLTARLADGLTTIQLHHIVHATAHTPHDTTPQHITFFLLPDGASFDGLPYELLIGWDSIQHTFLASLLAIVGNDATTNPTPNTNPTQISLNTITLRSSNDTGPPMYPISRPPDLGLYPPPSPETLAELHERNETAFANMLAAFDAERPNFVDPLVHARIKDIIISIKTHFTETLRPDDIILNTHTPLDTLIPGATLPYLPTRHHSPAKLALLRSWAGTMLAQNRITPATHRGPAPAPTFPTGGDKVRVVHDTSRLHGLFNTPVASEPTPEEKASMFGPACGGAKFDVPAAFHAVPTHPDTHPSLRQLSIGNDVFDSNVLLMGSPSSSAILTETMKQAFGSDINTRVLTTADDLTLPARGTDPASAQRYLLDSLRNFAKAVKHHNIPLKASKSTIYSTHLTYCGIQFTPQGHRPDPNCVDAIKHIHTPTTGEDLGRLHYGIGWVRRYIPNHDRRFSHLHEALERMYRDAGDRTLAALRKYRLSDYGVTPQHVEELRDAFYEAVTLAHRNPNKALVLTTDASDSGFGGALLQVDPAHTDTFYDHDSAEPLGFYGGKWTTAESKYPTHEKEGLAVIKCLNLAWHIINDGSTLTILTDN
jgi:hypothetical protein